MITTLDRYILRSLLINYFIALAVMLSLYVVLDMFVNMDEFTEQNYPFPIVLSNMVSYYAPNLLLYFSQLSGAITLFACLAAIARARSQNELTAMLASGVSLYRVAAPVLAFGMVSNALLVVDTEWCIPRVAHLLSRSHDDADGLRAYEVLFLRDQNGSLLSAGQFHPINRDLKELLVLVLNDDDEVVSTIEADRAVWSPPSPIQPKGRWMLDRGRTLVRQVAGSNDIGPREQRHYQPAKFFESNLDPETIQTRQSVGWTKYLNLQQLKRLDQDAEANHVLIAQTKHARIAAPLVNIVLLLLGLPFFLDRSPANVLRDAGKCMALCGLCYVSTFVAQSMKTDTVSALPAWIPIFVFATIAMVLVDRIRT